MHRIATIVFAIAAAGIAGAVLAQGSGISAEQRGQAFDRADANHDGKLSPDEFLTSPRGQAPNNPIISWLGSDKNKDGFVSRQEFIEPMTGESAAPAPARGG